MPFNKRASGVQKMKIHIIKVYEKNTKTKNVWVMYFPYAIEKKTVNNWFRN